MYEDPIGTGYPTGVPRRERLPKGLPDVTVEDRPGVHDPAGPYKTLGTRLAAVLAEHHAPDTVLPDLLAVVGWHAEQQGSTQMLSPMLVAYGQGLQEHAHRLRRARA